MKEKFWSKIALKTRVTWGFLLTGFLLGIVLAVVADQLASRHMFVTAAEVIHNQQDVLAEVTAELSERLEGEYLADLKVRQNLACAEPEFKGKRDNPIIVDQAQCLEMQKKGILVGVDPGHLGRTGQGYVNTGAVSLNGVPEYEFSLSVGLLLKEELISRGYDVFMVRETNDRKGYKLTPGDRAIVANEAGCDIVVCIHWDGNENQKHHGYHTIYRDGTDTQSYRLAAAISEVYGLAVEGNITRLRKPMKRTDLWQLNLAEQPMTFVETGYSSNESDMLWLTNEKNHPIIAKALADGIDLYFEREEELILSQLPSRLGNTEE